MRPARCSRAICWSAPLLPRRRFGRAASEIVFEKMNDDITFAAVFACGTDAGRVREKSHMWEKPGARWPSAALGFFPRFTRSARDFRSPLPCPGGRQGGGRGFRGLQISDIDRSGDPYPELPATGPLRRWDGIFDRVRQPA